jgi:hypothetical protein
MHLPPVAIGPSLGAGIAKRNALTHDFCYRSGDGSEQSHSKPICPTPNSRTSGGISSMRPGRYPRCGSVLSRSARPQRFTLPRHFSASSSSPGVSRKCSTSSSYEYDGWNGGAGECGHARQLRPFRNPSETTEEIVS